MQSVEKDTPEDCVPCNLLGKKLDIYMNLRSIRFGLQCSFIQKRTRSQQKIQSQFNTKKRFLFDEQLTHVKTMLDYNKAMTHKIIAHNYNFKYANINLNETAWQAQMKYKKVLNQCKLKDIRLIKRQRNYSEPKNKQTTKCQGRQEKPLKGAQCPYYFMNSYKVMQELIIQIKRKTTEAFISAYSHNEDDVQAVVYCDNLWAWIHGGLDFISKLIETDIFSRQHMVSSLKEYHHAQELLKQQLLLELFQDSVIVMNLQLSQKEIQIQRMDRLKELTQAMKIEENSENALDFDKIFFNFRRIKHKQYHQKEQQHITILARVMKIRPFTTASAEKCFLIEYYIGLHRAVNYEELIVTHPNQMQKYLQSL